MNTAARRTLVSIALGFLVGLVVSIVNGRSLVSSVAAAAAFSLLVGIVVAILSWAFSYAEKKGYSGWLGFFLVLVLNVFGVVLLLVLPNRNVEVYE